jgi:gliding motility-associated lipoprotein GldD
VLIFGVSCVDHSFLPKPRTYPKIIFPTGTPQRIVQTDCPFQFLFPTYGKVVHDSTFFEEKAKSDCWFTIQIPEINGTIFCSYFDVSSKEFLEKSINDAFKLAREHQIKATFLDEIPIKKPNSVYGMLFNIEGPVASTFQFYLTDSIQHFLRGALYFNTQAKQDSLTPFVEFAKKDIVELINTFEWK